jgi:hypothetical protein
MTDIEGVCPICQGAGCLFCELVPPVPPEFDGATYEPARDGGRLHAQLTRVYAILRDGTWHTLPELARKTGDPEASISARIRDLRKVKFGGRTIHRRYVDRGLHEYRMEADPADDETAA